MRSPSEWLRMTIWINVLNSLFFRILPILVPLQIIEYIINNIFSELMNLGNDINVDFKPKNCQIATFIITKETKSGFIWDQYIAFVVANDFSKSSYYSKNCWSCNLKGCPLRFEWTHALIVSAFFKCKILISHSCSCYINYTK